VTDFKKMHGENMKLDMIPLGPGSKSYIPTGYVVFFLSSHRTTAEQNL